MLPWRRQGERDDQCNRAVIVSMAKFYPSANQRDRPGASKDTKRLHKTLSNLGFKVELHNDLTAQEISQLFYNESRRPVRDCFLAVLSSHGIEGSVFGADGQAVPLSRIFSYFDNHQMEEKVKVFLIQACRGMDIDHGVEVDSASGDLEDLSLSQHLSVPVDTVMMSASSPGYGAFSSPDGSVFLKTFCTLLETERNRELELTRLLTRLSHSIAYNFKARGSYEGAKEMPCLLSRMTREVFPFAQQGKKGGATGLSATSLVGPEDDRRRKPSIS